MTSRIPVNRSVPSRGGAASRGRLSGGAGGGGSRDDRIDPELSGKFLVLFRLMQVRGGSEWGEDGAVSNGFKGVGAGLGLVGCTMPPTN